MERTVVEVSETERPIRAAIVDDHPLMREGVRKVLTAANIDVVAEAATGGEALRAMSETDVDVVLLDHRLPDCDGADLLKQLRNGSDAKFVMLTFSDDERHIRTALENGASGYLTKASESHEIVSAVRHAHDGQNVVSPDVATRLVSTLRRGDPAAARHLTPREREVWHLVAEGMSNVQIAKRLVVSTRTVKFHVTNLLRKLGVANRTHATRLALRGELFDEKTG